MTVTSPLKRGSKTLGILVSSADDKFENALICGVSDAVLDAGANWICYTSGAIRSHHGFESQRNMLYDLVNPEIVHGLVVSGTLGHGIQKNELREFCLGYDPIPVVTVAVELDGIPSVVNDSYQGIKEIVEHLLHVHQYKKIAFIRGPVGHQEADERFQAYKDVLLAHGFPEKEIVLNVVTGDYTMQSGQRAMEGLIASGRKFDAIVGANDSMALGALRVLHSHGYKVPQDVSLTGFDNTEDSRHSNPPLTTAQQLVYEMGRHAGRLLLARLDDKKTEEKKVVSPSMVIRESCGCSNQEVEKAASLYASSYLSEVPLYEETLRSMMQVVPKYLQERYQPWIEGVLGVFFKDVRGADNESFIEELEKVILYGFSISGSDVYWNDILSAMRRSVLENSSDGFDISSAEMLWQQARVLVGDMIRKHEIAQRLHVENRSVGLREISEMLMSSRRLSDVLDVLAMELPRLGVRSCFLSLFENVKSLEWSRLILAYDASGRMPLEQGEIRFRSRQLLPGGLLSKTNPSGFVAEALYSKDERLGFMLLEVDATESTVCGALRGLLSSALQGVILQGQREEAEKQLLHYQKNLEKLVENRTFELNEANQRLAKELADRERRKLEREALIQELESKNAELEQFAYTVSHDLKSPLVTIKGFLGYLKDDALSGNTQRLESDVKRISEAADRMYDLLSDLLELSRIGRMMNEPEDISFNELVSEAIEMTEGRLQEYNIKVTVDPDLPVVVGDRQRLLEVVQNLLDNAAKFMGNQSDPKIEVGVKGVEDNMPILYVRDNGIGVAPEFHERIFGLFNRLHPQVDGTGIGLALVKRIIEFHGGRIWIESEAGKGATFFFTLPEQQKDQGNHPKSI